MTPLQSGSYRAHAADLSGSEFDDVNLSKARFRNINLKSAVFEDVSLSYSSISNACLGGLKVFDANYEGMTIEGILVTDLLACWKTANGDSEKAEN